MTAEINLPIGRQGLATSFTESEVPVTFALKFRNRIINAAGGAEKRPGMVQVGDDVVATPNLTGLHEHVDNQGTATLFSSGGGAIYKFSGTSAWSSIYSGLDSSTALKSVQMEDALIFYNGVDRAIYTTDVSSFSVLTSRIEAGVMTGATSAAGTFDANVSSWALDTDVVTGDLLYNRTLNAYGVVQTVASAQITHSVIGSAQATGLGVASRNNDAGDAYEVIDLVELNVIDVDGILDNTSTKTSGSNATTIKVNGINFANTDIRVGDFVRNTTRQAIAKVSAINASALTVTSVASQTAGDSLIFYKDACPVIKEAHVHFGRLYAIDARDETKVRITGPNDFRDFTTDAATLDTNSFSFSSLQPQGDIAIGMTSFQRFFCIGGKENLFIYQGTNPVADTSSISTDFQIIGLFPQGIVSSDAIRSIGNDLVFATTDGIQSASLGSDSSQISRGNISEAIKTTLRDLIDAASPDVIKIIHYPRRSWFMVKLSDQIFVFNYTQHAGRDQALLEQSQGNISSDKGSWSLFDGKFARQRAYLVRRNGDLLCAGEGGKVYNFDQGTYDDDGETYKTEYQTPWMDFTELSRRFHDVRIKEVKYIKPIFDVGAEIDYTIRLEGGFDQESTDTITVGASGGAGTIGTVSIPFTIGGSPIQNIKYPLRGRGEQFRLTFSTEDAKGPDVLSRYTLYANYFGRR